MKSSTEQEQQLEKRIEDLRFAGYIAETRTESIVKLRHIIRRCNELAADIYEVVSLHSTAQPGDSPLQRIELCDEAIALVEQTKSLLYKVGGVE